MSRNVFIGTLKYRHREIWLASQDDLFLPAVCRPQLQRTPQQVIIAEAMPTHERLYNYNEPDSKSLKRSTVIENLIADLELTGRLSYCSSGILTTLSLNSNEVLLLQDIEHNVLMRIAYLRKQELDVIPQVEILFYVDNHLSYFPISVRGNALGRMALAKSQEQLVVFADYWIDALRKQVQTDHKMQHNFYLDNKYLEQEISLISFEQQRLEGWIADTPCEATDGCYISPHDICKHGYPSWFVELNLIRSRLTEQE